EVARLLLRPQGARRVVVLAGKGNNGGDGLVAARHLAGEAVVRVLLLVPPAELAGEPARHLKAVLERRVRVDEADALPAPGLAEALREADLIIDAIFGTGFRGPARGRPARVIEAANGSGTPILAVDLPSGADALNGRADPPCIHAAATVAMALPKVGTVQYPAAAHVGRLYVADIGVPASLVREAPIPTEMATAPWVDRTLPRRPAAGHKGRFGRVAILAGAPGLARAPLLAAGGSLRAGGGLVTGGLDADGLNAVAGDARRLRDVPGPLVITPHPGEMARLLGREIREVQDDRLGTAREAARLIGGVAVLKGARTVVAAPEGRAFVI